MREVLLSRKPDVLCWLRADWEPSMTGLRLCAGVESMRRPA